LPIQLVPAGVCAAVLSLDHLDAIRLAEIDKIVPFLPPGARVLDLGAGTGKQALELERRGFEVTAIEIAGSNYAMNRVFPVTDYDGRTIPLADASIDVVFSSNVLEHVPDLSRMHGEIRRVLAPGGICLHVLPTHTWRLWTTLGSYLEAISFSVSSLPRLLPQAAPNVAERQRLRQAWYRTARHTIGLCLPRRHGERGNVVSELWLFHPRWWRRNFRDNAFPSSATSPWGCSTPGKCFWACTLALPSVSAWRWCWAALVTSSGLCRCRDRAHDSPQPNSRAICCAGRPVVS
jgi:ubiquinone/menaquinone biosynthesis C-methylase UbiE